LPAVSLKKIGGQQSDAIGTNNGPIIVIIDVIAAVRSHFPFK